MLSKEEIKQIEPGLVLAIRYGVVIDGHGQSQVYSRVIRDFRIVPHGHDEWKIEWSTDIDKEWYPVQRLASLGNYQLSFQREELAEALIDELIDRQNWYQMMELADQEARQRHIQAMEENARLAEERLNTIPPRIYKGKTG